MNTCSHIWKDRRFIHQLVYNWPVSPVIGISDGQPRKTMQHGQTYECQDCHIPLFVPMSHIDRKATA